MDTADTFRRSLVWPQTAFVGIASVNLTRMPVGAHGTVATGYPARWAGLRDLGPLARNALPAAVDPARWAGLKDLGPLARNAPLMTGNIISP